jgi:hypothetical protein
MFYEGMRAAGITESTAKIMYFAVRMGGPRWDDQTMVNSNVPRPLPQISSTEITKAAEPIGRLLEDISEGDQISQLFTIEKTAKIASLSLDEIDARADFEREKPKPPLIVTPERERGSDRHNLISGVSSFEVKGILDSDQMSLKDNDFEM